MLGKMGGMRNQVKRTLIGAGLALAAGALCAQGQAPALTPCRLPGIDSQVMCGKVSRPLDEAKPSAKQIDVHFAVLPAIARNKLPDPVVLFAGGPGQSGMKLAPVAQGLFNRLRNRRDVIVVDQRGVGKSTGLDCTSNPREPMAASDMGAVAQRMLQCKTALKAKHGLTEEQLTHFTTEKASKDIEAIRVAIGAEKLNLVGASYGTRAALDYMRQYPSSVRRVVIDGVAPPDMVLPDAFEQDADAALQAVFKACEADKSCNARHPKLAQSLERALAALPQPLDVRHPVTLQREKLVLTREMLLASLRSPLYVPSLAQALPLAISQAAQGDYAPLMGLAGGMATPATELAWGMHFSVVCAEDFPRMSAAAPVSNTFSGSLRKLYTDVCSNWPQAPVSAAFYTLPAAKVPVLVMSGGADPVTPPRHGERTAKALGPQARHVIAPQVGHGVMAVGCGKDILYQFIHQADDAKALAVDAKCVERIPRPLPFAMPVALEAAKP